MVRPRKGDQSRTASLKIKVASDPNQFNIDVSIDGTTVLAQQQDQTPDDDVEKLQSAPLDAIQALERAAAQQGGTLSELEIDRTADGTVVWQIDLRQPDGSIVEVNVNATTGDVVNRTTSD